MNAIVLDPKSLLGDSWSHIPGHCDPYTLTTPFVSRLVNSDNERAAGIMERPVEKLVQRRRLIEVARGNTIVNFALLTCTNSHY